MTVIRLAPAQADLATAVLCEAFAGYPVMRFVLGSGANYPERLQTLIGFFVEARVLRQDLLLGVPTATGDLAAVALVTLPTAQQPTEALAARREAVWSELGIDARARYEAFGEASHRFDIAAPHHHLNMIGVRTRHLGQGHARTLLEQVHRLADEDPGSAGVTLSTETGSNVPLYEHFGYRQVGYAKVAPALETWAFYRPGGPPAETPSR